MKTDLMTKDLSQRQLALDAGKSFIVQAPAGSGKTELLIQRMLVLLSQVNKPEEVVAITFTKKAANEMRERIMQALHQAAMPCPSEHHKQQTWYLAKKVLEKDELAGWHILDNPNQLRIQTIDSLCSFLTKQLPILSQFGAQPELAENSQFLYEDAVGEILSHIEASHDWSPAIARLLLHLDNDLNKLHDLLVNLLAKRDQWLPHIHFGDNEEAIKFVLEENIQYIINDHLNLLERLFPFTLKQEMNEIASFAADKEHHDRFSSWQWISELLLTKSGEWRKQLRADIGFPALSSIKNKQEKAQHTEMRKRLHNIIEVISANEALRQALSVLSYLPSSEINDMQWEILFDLIQILKVLTAQLRLSFQLHGKIDFTENSLAALTALGQHEQPTDLALALDYQLQHILVDEFQDTSSTQFFLLEKLTYGWQEGDGRTLFVVGDPMQSIYRFREAEVGLFIRMRQNGIGNIKLIPLTLSLNFRSTPKIVEWNNHHFQSIFPAFTDFASGAVSYSPSTSNKNPVIENIASEVNIQGFISSNDQAQSNYLVNCIQTIHKQSPNESIAILVRSRSHLSSIIPALKMAGISYRAIDIDPLNTRQIIQDLLSLTCALLHPGDRIAWLSVFRAPWCGLTLADLLVLAKDKHSHIMEQAQLAFQHSAQLSHDGQKRLKRVLPILKNALDNRQRYAFRLWVESTWILLGGPACLNEKSNFEDADVFFKLLEKISETNTSYSIDLLKERIHHLYASSENNDPHAVQISTIHSAKGLEYDTVILPHLEKKMPNDDKSLLSWMEHPLVDQRIALLLAPIQSAKKDENKLYDYILRQQKIKSQHESDRLLYVAATRAKKRLYFSFLLKTDSRHQMSGSFLEKLIPFIKDDWIQMENIKNIASEKLVSRSIKRLVTDWQNPVSLNHSQEPIIHQSHQGFMLSNLVPRILGTCLHSLLQQLAVRGIHWWKNCNEVEQTNYICRLLRRYHLPINELAACTEKVFCAIRNTLDDEKGQWILSQHDHSKTEFPISALINQQAENLIIDRTFICENKFRWIIDYKTSEPVHESLNLFLESEKNNYKNQMQAYASAIKAYCDRPVKLALYFPLLPAWTEY